MDVSPSAAGETGREHPDVRWGLPDALFWLVVAQVGGAVWFVAVLQIFHNGEQPESIPMSTRTVLQFGFVLAYGIGPWLTTSLRGRGPRLDYWSAVKPEDAGIGFAAGLITQFVVIPALYFPILFFVDQDPSEVARRLMELVSTNTDRLLLILIVVVLAPLVEEFFFRGLLLQALLHYMGRWPAVVLQAFVFSAVHFQPLQAAGLFVFGLVAGALVTHSGRLGPAWAMHVAFNGATVAVLL